jgi:hypothetical protein
MMRLILVLFLVLPMMAGCSNWKEEPAISKVIFINALPGSNEATLLFDGQPLNSEPLPYDTFTTYQNIRAGRRIVSVKLSSNSEPIIIDTLYVPEFKNYTAILTQDITKNPVDNVFLFYPDTLTKPATGKANVRFMNLYADKNAVLELVVVIPDSIKKDSTRVLFSNRKFLNVSRFVATDTSSTYVFTLRNNGKLVNGLSDTLKLSRQNSYTILVTDSSGNVSGEKKPKLKLITHQ